MRGGFNNEGEPLRVARVKPQFQAYVVKKPNINNKLKRLKTSPWRDCDQVITT